MKPILDLEEVYRLEEYIKNIEIEFNHVEPRKLFKVYNNHKESLQRNNFFIDNGYRMKKLMYI